MRRLTQEGLNEFERAVLDKCAERWAEMGAREQAGLLNKWAADAARNQELADVLRGLLELR